MSKNLSISQLEAEVDALRHNLSSTLVDADKIKMLVDTLILLENHQPPPIIAVTNKPRPLDADWSRWDQLIEAVDKLADRHGQGEELQKVSIRIAAQGKRERHPWSVPLEHLPCANVDVQNHFKCPLRGEKRCAGCKLTSYCSRVRTYFFN